MGQKHVNIEAVIDYADGRTFVRLHRDVAVPAVALEAIRSNLAAGRWDAAKTIALEHAPEDAHEEIHSFFDRSRDRLASVAEHDRVAEAV